MFTQEEINEINVLCKENELFAKYINRYEEENERLLASVTHEMGNQLTLISSTAQLMESRNAELHDIKYWDQLRSDIEVMREYFLSFSQYRHGSQLECRETDLVDLVEETVESFQAVAVQKNVSVEMEEAEELDITLFSCMLDSVKIKQAIVNLMKNALEAVKEGERIWVRLLGKEQTGSDYIKIEIGNNGELIQKENLKTIFEFGVSEKGDGRGIGLALTDKIVKAHKGILEVVSEEEAGERKTVFSIHLPA